MKFAEYIETKRHGSPDFPIEYYHVSEGNFQYVMEAHWHKEFEIIRVVSGEFNLYLNGEEYLLSDGDVAFIGCGCLHRGEPRNCVYECLVFDLNMLKRQQNDAAESFISPIISSSAGVTSCLSKKDTDIKNTVDMLFEKMAKREEYYQLEVYGLLFLTFSMLYSHGYILKGTEISHGRQAKKVTELINWLNENFTEPISLDKLAAHTGLSEKYICRVFKEYTSKTPMTYINELRIENACYEMAKMKKNVTQAAYDSGFNDLSYFCKTFKRYKGVTPNEYRKNI